jgi:hypothetical protein
MWCLSEEKWNSLKITRFRFFLSLKKLNEYLGIDILRIEHLLWQVFKRSDLLYYSIYYASCHLQLGPYYKFEYRAVAQTIAKTYCIPGFR